MRHRFRRARTARSAGFRFRRGKRKISGYGGVKLVQPDAMIYGAVRQYASNALAPVTGMIPLGTVSDEIGMGILNYFVAKNTHGFISDIAKKGLIIENARIGEAVVQDGLGLLGTTTSRNNVGVSVAYPYT